MDGRTRTGASFLLQANLVLATQIVFYPAIGHVGRAVIAA